MIRRTPLKRSTKPLKRSGKPISRFSKRKMAERRQYAKRAKAFKVAHPVCAGQIPTVCTGFTHDVHHVFGRGKYLLVESTWLPLCRGCHTHIHLHPGTARTLNLLH